MTVQRQAVNLADAEPCLFEVRLFYCALGCAHKAAQSGRVGDRAMNENRFETTTSRPKPAGARWNASTAPGPGGALVRRCAIGFEDAHRCRKCASWKTPTIPSKMRTLFQGAHRKAAPLRTTVRRGRPVRPVIPLVRGRFGSSTASAGAPPNQWRQPVAAMNSDWTVHSSASGDTIGLPAKQQSRFPETVQRHANPRRN
jgi:hypothetical protein